MVGIFLITHTSLMPEIKTQQSQALSYPIFLVPQSKLRTESKLNSGSAVVMEQIPSMTPIIQGGNATLMKEGRIEYYNQLYRSQYLAELQEERERQKQAVNKKCNNTNNMTMPNRRDTTQQLLYYLVQAEAGNQDLDGCRLVADVVLNRIDSGKFPNDLESVVYAPGQFSVVRNGALKKAQGNVSEKVVQAVNMELAGERLNSEVLYFNNANNGGWKHGGHWFK